MEIMGTGLMAMSRETDDMYDVAGSEDTLPGSGMGDITVGAAMYHVWMDEDGILTGARFDMAIKDKLQAGPEDAGGRLLTPADVSLSTDDSDTMANEASTHLVVAGDMYPVGDLLGGGTASLTGKTFVEKARDDVATLLTQVQTLADLNASLDRDDRQDYTTIFNLRWADAQKAVNSIFGKKPSGDPVIELPELPTRGGEVDEEDAVADFEELVDALAALEFFEEALDDGILEDGAAAVLKDKDADEVFGAVVSESRLMLRTTATTRYGVFAKQGRNVADDDLEFTVAGSDTDDHQGAIGAFAYGLVDDTVRTSHLPSSGTASFMGGTVAVSGQKDPQLYSGTFSMEVNFPTSRVTAQITELEDEEGDAWQYQLRDVVSIYFPAVTLNGKAEFSSGSNYRAEVTHIGFAARPIQVNESTFAGWLLGAGRDEEAATGAIGTWSIGNRENAGSSYVVGSFGAERTGIGEDVGPSVGVAAGVESWVASGADADEIFEQSGSVFRPLGDEVHPDADEDGPTYEISLSTLEQDGEGGKTLEQGERKIDALRDDISKLLAKLEGVIAVDESDGDLDGLGGTNADRDEIWQQIKTRLLADVFGVADDATTEVDESVIYAGMKGRPAYDAELDRRPAGSMDPVDAPDWDSTAVYYYVQILDDEGDSVPNTEPETTTPPTPDAHEGHDIQELGERAELMVLDSENYPGLDADMSGKPKDDSARQEIEAVLDALADGDSLAEALGEDGLFEGLLAETRSTYLDENYDGYADVKSGKRRVDDPKTGTAWGARTFKTHVQLGLTSYTRFGVTWGKSDATSFAYSPLPQVQYERGVAAPGYPGGSRATYTGGTVVRVGADVPYEGVVEVDVSWSSVAISASEITVTFSELAKVADSEPFSIGYILVDDSGDRFLMNGKALASNDGAVGTAAGFIDYHAFETVGGGKYRGLDDTARVEAQGTVDPEVLSDTQVATAANIQMSKDPRNDFADMVTFDVAQIKFRTEIKAATDDGFLSFSNTNADVEIIWENTGFDRTMLGADISSGMIEGEFVGQGSDGPLAAMGIWSFVAPTGVLTAAVDNDGLADDHPDRSFDFDGDDNVDTGETGLAVGWKDGSTDFMPAARAGETVPDRFNPNARHEATGDLINAYDAMTGAIRHEVTNATTGVVTAYNISGGGYLTTTVGSADPSFGSTVFGAFGTGPTEP
jgi:hypothetical protein